ncbi:YopX family protein [Streptococcus pneumoniae]|uniref:YopX family protein n=1 Tax=Streptococcus pneumoniae TaxID=1313 RepID=UPI0005E4BAC0|nr:YopX family protein [Streptococcus pneumoniae]MDD0775856.1 YopX family protein [Streptococcus pneumoniae]MDD0792706.1 YopX family protein [Streptococcus pneumoniae]MDG7801925.1 YopX family protein [Streptococcus pneumoniae]MDG8016832.1 YopX family protein [Streptococcus pneumoniae]MDG8036350.1 YopX family protein [Streptococcus pneumoniae]
MIPKFRVWHYELGRLMSVKCMFFQDSEIEEFELNDALMNDCITAYPDEIELMQSTGFKDKNGKEIFEGDIVRTTRFLGRADEIGGFYEYEKDYVGVVKVLEGSWVIDTGSVAVRLWSEIDESEVLGNIYENLEFLEVNE